ncbi:hypothetical protein ACH4E7_31460 [Kitasatospora sp. NPDC018058]|uniref:hypothetical protein n=1 Tax=Kitasatospora sp. NPDC018058 TaxID=3364025 RepID=UPI0037C077F3
MDPSGGSWNGGADDSARTRRRQAFISSVMHGLKQQGITGAVGTTRKPFGVVRKVLVIDDGWSLGFAQQARPRPAATSR